MPKELTRVNQPTEGAACVIPPLDGSSFGQLSTSADARAVTICLDAGPDGAVPDRSLRPYDHHVRAGASHAIA
jgi:hypothetical protein